MPTIDPLGEILSLAVPRLSGLIRHPFPIVERSFPLLLHLGIRKVKMYSSSPNPVSSACPSLISSYLPLDDEECNSRITPVWTRYRTVIGRRGFRLDTVRDVRAYYDEYVAAQGYQGAVPKARSTEQSWRGYPSNSEADDDLFKDRGLPDNLFRGTCVRDGSKVIIKAVNILSRELEVTQYLSSPTLRRDPANHTIPILDIIRFPSERVAFIVQEDWSSSFAHSAPCSYRGFLHAVRQCIEGLYFMHLHSVAHLDLSLTNILTNSAGSYAYIDFELSRRFHGEQKPNVRCLRGTELPPEIERGEDCCPFKVDVWALGVTILRICKAAGYDIPELLMLSQTMLKERPQDRPSARTLLLEFDRLFAAHLSKKKSGAPTN